MKIKNQTHYGISFLACHNKIFYCGLALAVDKINATNELQSDDAIKFIISYLSSFL